MHLRNVFKNGIDYKYLSKKYPELCNYINVDFKSGRYNFVYNNINALMELARVLLLEHYNLDMNMTKKRLH